MTKMSYRPYRPSDAESFKLRSVFTGLDDISERLDRYHKSANVTLMTVLLEDAPIGIFGLTQIWTGVAEVWSLLSDDVKKASLSFHRMARSLLEDHIKEFRLHRVQATVRCDFSMGFRWLESLGFEIEAMLNHFGPNKEDFFLYARRTER